jgi:hypothetical protein
LGILRHSRHQKKEQIMAKNQRLIISIDCRGSSTKAIGDTASKTNAGLELSATTRTTLVMDSDIIEVPSAYSLKIENFDCWGSSPLPCSGKFLFN